jgi:hypothetical protein
MEVDTLPGSSAIRVLGGIPGASEGLIPLIRDVLIGLGLLLSSSDPSDHIGPFARKTVHLWLRIYGGCARDQNTESDSPSGPARIVI